MKQVVCSSEKGKIYRMYKDTQRSFFALFFLFTSTNTLLLAQPSENMPCSGLDSTVKPVERPVCSMFMLYSVIPCPRWFSVSVSIWHMTTPEAGAVATALTAAHKVAAVISRVFMCQWEGLILRTNLNIVPQKTSSDKGWLLKQLATPLIASCCLMASVKSCTWAQFKDYSCLTLQAFTFPMSDRK